MILDRQQFINYFNDLQPELGNITSPLWEPERVTNTSNDWFVCVKPILAKPSWGEKRSTYYQWCEQNLKNSPNCYSSDDINQQEWWGFKNREDIVIWMLKWIK